MKHLVTETTSSPEWPKMSQSCLNPHLFEPKDCLPTGLVKSSKLSQSLAREGVTS